MRNYSLTKEIPLNDSYEVIVVGGGPAGCTAAAAAAREGSQTLLIEATGALGGMGTQGLVPCWAPFSDKEKMIYRGIAQRIFERAKAGMPHVNKKALDWVPIDSELLKRVYDDIVTSYGAEVLFHTHVASVDCTNGKINAIIASNKAGLTAFSSKVFVDCTGDADVAAWAGAEFDLGDSRFDGETQPATLCFILSNVDGYGYQVIGKIHAECKNSVIYKILESEKYSLVKDAHCCNLLIGPNTVGFNAGHLWNINGTDPVQLSKAMMEGRKLAHQLHEGLIEFCPKAFANSFLVSTAPLMGIRETRRIRGDYVLTVQDYLDRRTFEDEIARNSYYMDVHLTDEERQLAREGKMDDAERCSSYGKGESHGIPYRCLTPVGLDNILVAGRSISAERMVQGSIRVMPTCLAMGEAAGIAASMAAKAGVSTHDVDVKMLRERLLEEGAYIL